MHQRKRPAQRFTFCSRCSMSRIMRRSIDWRSPSMSSMACRAEFWTPGSHKISSSMAFKGTDALPDDPGTLKAMVLAERAWAERLEQIIKELQRHRFGRRAETLPEDQLLLGLEEANQVEAAGEAAAERGACQARQESSLAPRQPGIASSEMLVDIESHACPGCRRRLASDRRRSGRAARHHPRPVPGPGCPPAHYRGEPLHQPERGISTVRAPVFVLRSISRLSNQVPSKLFHCFNAQIAACVRFRARIL
jgi:Transposase C of IS166 homeodomain